MSVGRDGIESVTDDELRRHQDAKLVETVRHAYENVPYYRNKLDTAGVSPDDITGVRDIHELPFTTKSDFRETYPDGLFAVDDEAVKRVHSSSGTTGTPKVVAYTPHDLDIWTEVMGRTLRLAGVTEEDRLQNAFGYGLFTGGFGVHHGTEAVGAGIVPTGGGQSRRQIEFLRDLEVDAITATPSYALRLLETADEMGVDLRELPVSTVIHGAAISTEPLRDAIEDGFGATAIDIYGLSELIGPGVAAKCRSGDGGLHIFEDHFYPEVVDPETGEPVDHGEEGELVLTSLSKEALPILRYRTGDLTRLHTDDCECGRSSVRMDHVRGRTDDLLTIRGVNFYPSEVEAVALEMDAIAPYYRLDVRRDGTLDELHVTVETVDSFDGDVDGLRDRLFDRLQNTLSFRPDSLDVVEYGTLERSDGGKAQRVHDHRSFT